MKSLNEKFPTLELEAQRNAKTTATNLIKSNLHSGKLILTLIRIIKLTSIVSEPKLLTQFYQLIDLEDVYETYYAIMSIVLLKSLLDLIEEKKTVIKQGSRLQHIKLLWFWLQHNQDEGKN